MGVFGDCITSAALRSRAYAERLLKDVTAAQFARKPRVGGVLVDCNHPAWVFGHLSLYPRNVSLICSLSIPSVAPPESYEPLFKNGQPCLDDPEGTIHPSMESIVSTYFSVTDAILGAVARMDDSAFNAPNPNENYAKFFPVVGGACVFMLNNHVMMHLGQISTWRRCMGLGAA